MKIIKKHKFHLIIKSYDKSIEVDEIFHVTEKRFLKILNTFKEHFKKKTLPRKTNWKFITIKKL